MKGYKKIASGSLTSSRLGVKCNDNYDLDDQIRSVVHSAIIGNTEKTGNQEYFVVVYKKVSL
jgi:hypothetical protein